jgi:hypothetical protein
VIRIVRQTLAILFDRRSKLPALTQVVCAVEMRLGLLRMV